MKKSIKLAGLFAGAVVVLSACSLGSSTNLGSRLGDGGVFKSPDAATTWSQIVEVLATKGQVLRFLNEDINAIELDPEDHNGVFAGTRTAGLLYSFDGGESWTQDDKFANTEITSIAIDNFDKCKWVVSTPVRIYRTLDCGRGWREMLSESRVDFKFVKIIADHFNKNVLYVANTREIMKSNDYGETWQTIKRFNSEITDFIMDFNDSRVLYVTFWGAGVEKTNDGGANWKSMSEQLDSQRGGNKVRVIKQDRSKENSFMIANDYGLFKTSDAGENWQSIELLTPPDSVDIYAIALDPEDSNIIYYATGTTLYKTHDGGENWKTSRLPSQRRPSVLTVDYKDGNVLYLGTKVADRNKQPF